MAQQRGQIGIGGSVFAPGTNIINNSPYLGLTASVDGTMTRHFSFTLSGSLYKKYSVVQSFQCEGHFYRQYRNLVGLNGYVSYHPGRRRYKGIYGGVNLHYFNIDYKRIDDHIIGEGTGYKVPDLNQIVSNYFIAPGIHVGYYLNLSRNINLGAQAEGMIGYAAPKGISVAGQVGLNLKYRLY